jgi:hypothetical protein
MTFREAKTATLLTALPSVVMMALVGVYWVIYKPYRGGDDLFITWIREALGGLVLVLAPVMVLVAVVGIIFSFQRILTLRQRAILWIIHAAAGAIGVWIVVTVIQGMRMWGGLRM